jgi:hypothetical protein
MTTTNGTGHLIDKRAAMKILGLSHSHFDRLVRRGDLPVARRVDRGYPGLFSKRTTNNANATVPQSVTRRFACI